MTSLPLSYTQLSIKKAMQGCAETEKKKNCLEILHNNYMNLF